jgi:large repetitive protein
VSVVDVQGLGPLVDLATAIGLVNNGQLDPSWFSAPGDHVGQMLRQPGQRDALLRAADQLLAHGAPPLLDDAGRRWIELFAEDPVALHVVVSVDAATGTTELGLGVRVEATTPESHVQAYIPLLQIPTSGPATVAFGTSAGRVSLEGEVTFAGGLPAPGDAGLQGLRLAAEVATDGSAPLLSVELRGLQLPGQASPSNVSLDGNPAQLGDQALRLILGLVQQSVAGATGELAELLALVGITADPAIPPLPIADLLSQGLPAWRTWLDTLLADTAALDAWLNHVALLAGHGATVAPAAAPGLPHRVSWTLTNGLTLAAVLQVTRTAGGAPSVELGLQGVLTATGALPGSLELDASLTRITLGATPSVVGLPRLELTGRIGNSHITGPADLLLNLQSPSVLQVGSLRAGVTLGEDRRVAFVLAAHDVTISTHSYPTLDLTNAHTLADVGGTAVGDLLNEVLGQLGPAGTAVEVLLGRAAPPGQAAWPVPLTDITHLLANPIAALVSYHQSVLNTYRVGYAAVLDSLRGLLAPAGVTTPISGTGDEATPWRLVLVTGTPVVAVVAWTTPTGLELGAAVDCTIGNLGGSCPTVTLGLLARLASISFSGSGSHALAGISARITFGARGGGPLQIGTDDAAIVADRAGLELNWTPAVGFKGALAVPGLAAVIDGEQVPFAIPTLTAGGALSADVPWRALELLLGHVLIRFGPSWTEELTRLLGWLPGEGGDLSRLPLEALIQDPVAAVRAWVAALVRQGAVAQLARRLALVITGPAAPGLPAGTYRGRGDAHSPLAIPLAGGAADPLRVELLLWAGYVANDPGPLAPGSLIAALGEPTDDANPSPGAERVAAALERAGSVSDQVADLMVERRDLSDGLTALATRWTDTDGMVRAADAVLSDAITHDLDNVTHLALPDADLAGITGVDLDVGTIVVTGPLGRTTWPGIDATQTIDLSTPGLTPEAFDISRLSAEDGPWLVLLPSRVDAVVAAGDDGAAMQAARLARVVDAVVARVAGNAPVALVAHGAAGHAAAAVAGRTGVTHLVTLGTPHVAIGLDVLESQPAAGALQLLSRLLPPADANSFESDQVLLGRGLVDILMAAYDAPASPLGDLAPPSTAPVVPAGVEVHCVRGRCGAGAVAQATGAVVVRGLEDIAESQVASPPGDEALGIGVGIAFDPPATPGALHVTVEVALTAQAFAGGARPGLRARIGVGRPGGWLTGGPDPARPANVSRQPSLRRAEVEFDLPAAGTPSARLVFHEASALGVSRRRWVVSQNGGGDPLLPEARVLVGRLAAALGPLPASGPVRVLADALGALGLVDETGGVPTTGATIGFSVDGIRRLLVDPGGLFADLATPAGAARVANALADLLGAPAPATATPTEVVFQLGPCTIHADIAAATIRVEAAALATDAGATLGGAVELGTGHSLSGQITLAFGDGASPNGRPVLEVSAAPLQVRLRWEGAGAAMPASVELAPTPDGPGIARLLTTVLPAQLLWAGITFLRSLDPNVTALMDPVLAAFGLLKGSGPDTRVVVPTALIADPAHWFSHPTLLGDGSGALDAGRLGAFLDAVATLLSIPQPRSGAWTLPYGLELSTRNDAGRTAIGLSMTQAIADTGLRVGGSVGLALGTSGVAAAPTAELILALPGTGALTAAGRVTLSLGPGGLSGHLIVPASNIDLVLFPNGAGLAALGQTAVAIALPMVLDGVAGLTTPPAAQAVGVALAALGDAMGLRSGGHFVAAEITALAADPATQFAQRLSQNLPVALGALANMLGPALPTNYALALSGTDLVFSHTGTTVSFEVRATVPAGSIPAGLRLGASVSGVHPFTGASLSGTFAADASGLTEASVTFAVDPANGIHLGPIILAPVAELAIGSNPTGGPHVAAGLAVDATRTLRAVLHMGASPSFALEATGDTLPDTLVRLLLPTAVNIALSIPDVQALLARQVLGTSSIGQLLNGVLLTPAGAFDTGILDTTQLFPRILILAGNIAALAPALPLNPLTIKVSQRNVGTAKVYGVALSLPPGQRYDLVSDGTTVSIEVDPSWINPVPAADGLVVELLSINNNVPAVSFGISVNGIGVRIGRSDGPLLDSYLVVDTVALHGLVTVTTAGGVTDVGGQLELGNLRIALGSASGGTNEVASGVLRDSASGGQKPEPKFSPALAIQSHGGGPPKFNLRAGEGDGPWWVTIQRAFGPVYIEQVGFGVSRSGDQIIAASVMVDGKVSFMGLTVAVDDLAVGAHWPQTAADPPLYDPRAWSIDLAGLGVAANTSGVSIAGGLSKSPGALPDYVGMISIRFSVYAISAYGGYAVVTDASGKYTSLFIFGALNAPIGGPPAFFVTGLGAGVGVNRLMLLPSDLNQFPSYPLLQALDRNSPMADPETALAALRAYFPPSRGAFWFAAGLSFNSFSLIDGIAVVGVAIGDGLDINLLGLARAGLPNPSFPLVQIELALVARFSSREGVLWIQAQLTDNSFLLTRDCRLTGGFAYVMWFKGNKSGQFVCTLGGYHPSFHRDGYPVVPRLGFVWCVSDVLVIKGESYFALVSEAIMAGTRFEASLTLGPLWAYLRLGADGIVYFDPFHFQVTAYAELGGGITIDVDLGWFGHVRVTISVSLHADVVLEGPEFHGSAKIDLDVTSATIAFGNSADRSTPALGWADFESKYLRPNNAAMLTAVPGFGTLPPSTDGNKKAPTGGTDDPFLVLPEFVLNLTTTAATSAVTANGPVTLPFSVFLSIGPMQIASVTSTLSASIKATDGTEYVQTLSPAPVSGQFPKGAWGPQAQSEPKPVPSGDTVEAVSGVTLTAEANISVGTVEVDYHQVEIGPRLQLPFLAETAVRADRAADVTAAAALEGTMPSDVAGVLTMARGWLTGGPEGSALTPLAAAMFARRWSAPPQLVPLTHGMAVNPGPPVAVPIVAPAGGRVPADTSAQPLRVDAVLMGTGIPGATPRIRTTVGTAGAGVARVTPVGTAEARAALDPRLATRLVTAAAPAVTAGSTVIPAGTAPFTGRAGSGGELRRESGQAAWRVQRLRALSDALPQGGIDLLGGELAVLTTPNGLRDVEQQRPALTIQGDLPLRLVAMDIAGEVTLDTIVLTGTVPLPPRTERVALVGGGGAPGGAPGWQSGTQLAQVGARALIGPGCTVSSSAVVTRRGRGRVAIAFTTAADAMGGYSIVTTRLPADINAVAIVLETTATRVEDGRGDALDLALEGADRVLGPDGKAEPPRTIVAGRRTINVYAILPDGKEGRVAVTVASGEHLYLGGVIGGRNGAAALTESLRRDVASTLGGLFDTPSGKTHVAWVPQPTAPAATAGPLTTTRTPR